MIFKSKLQIATFLLLTVVAIGVVGYMTIADDNFVDSLYMTIITMSTVGFGEIHKFSTETKLFTIFLILISIVVYGYSVTAITEYLASSNFFQIQKYKKVEKEIGKMENHTIVCGYGRNGKQAVNKLRQFNEPCVVIEKRMNEIADLQRDGVLYIEGDATNDDDLKKLRLDKAKSLITALPSDADNLFVVYLRVSLIKTLQ
jgi:voltage-gated potassium channel